MRRHLPVFAVASLLAACVAAPAIPPSPRAELVGTYDVESVDYVPLPATAPGDSSVVLESITLRLDRSGRFTIISSHTAGPRTESTTIGGEWVASASILRIHGDQGPAVLEYGYRLDDGILRLTDAEGHVWALRRR